MSAGDFEQILDLALTEVLAGRRTVESCLEAWPQFADHLEGPLRTAIALHAEQVADIEPSRRARAELMATIQSTPQDAPRRRLSLLWLSSLFRPAILAPAAAVAAVAVALVMFGSFGSSPAAEAATLTTFGTVERADGGRWRSLADDARLHEGDRIRTSPESSAVLTFADGSTVTLGGATEVILERAYRPGRHPLLLRQVAGRLWSNVGAGDSASIELATSAATVIAARTASFETAVQDGETAVHAPEGTVEVRAGGQRLVANPEEQIRATATGSVQRSAAPLSDRTVVITAPDPLVASIVDPHGLATGVTPDGLVYRQIPRTLTTPSGARDTQQIVMLAPTDGLYTLVLRRLAAGTAAVEARAGDVVRRIEIPSSARAYAVRLRVNASSGATSIEVESATAVDPERINNLERLVVTDEARRHAAEVLRALRERRLQPTTAPATVPAR